MKCPLVCLCVPLLLGAVAAQFSGLLSFPREGARRVHSFGQQLVNLAYHRRNHPPAIVSPHNAERPTYPPPPPSYAPTTTTTTTPAPVQVAQPPGLGNRNDFRDQSKSNNDEWVWPSGVNSESTKPTAPPPLTQSPSGDGDGDGDGGVDGGVDGGGDGGGGLVVIPPSLSEEAGRNDANEVEPPAFSNAQICRGPEGGLGTCVVIYECNPYLRQLQSGSPSPQLVALLRAAQCGFEQSTPKVCCPVPSLPTVGGDEETRSEPPPSPATDQAPLSQDSPEELPRPPVCGVSPGLFPKVVGGEPAKLGDFPWMAVLGYRARSPGGPPRWLCGGSLISRRHVLTAAHCINKYEDQLYIARLGELDLNRDDDGATPVDMPVSKMVKHEGFSEISFSNDVGVLLLDGIVTYTNLIKPLCLPLQPELRSKSFERYRPFLAGWGDTQFRGPSATHLQRVQLPVVSNERCARAYINYTAQKIDERVLCAGFEQGGRDSCQGDSGGPLMQPVLEDGASYFYQIGLVSYGRQCATAGYPGVYSRITYFLPWIQDIVISTTS